MPTYRVTYTWTKDEYLKSLRYHQRAELRPVLAWVFDGFIAFVGLGGGFLAVYLRAVDPYARARGDSVVVPYVAIAFGLYWLLRHPLNEWWLVRNFLKHPSANTLVDGEFSEEHVVSRTNVSSSVQEWKLFTKVLEVKEGFLLYTYPTNAFYWLPFSGFESSEAIQEFKRII